MFYREGDMKTGRSNDYGVGVFQTGMMCVLLFLFVFVASALSVARDHDGSQMVSLSGKLVAGSPKKIAIKEIEALGITSVKFYSPYVNQTVRCSGVWLERLVSKYGGKGATSVTMTALDKYSIAFPLHTIGSNTILLVTREDGKYIGYDQKGPLRIVYPGYDKKGKESQDTLPNWIWMIKEITFQ